MSSCAASSRTAVGGVLNEIAAGRASNVVRRRHARTQEVTADVEVATASNAMCGGPRPAHRQRY
ncbi:hypothetical protein F01_460433 [Burkholderia cenocepacia]|nr:hypothetical protein F01_460433 [Burkholderia cenocepacia]